MENILTSQADIQTIYATMGPSGLYYSLRLSLYEIPLSWIHHAMLISLLSTVDKTVQPPILNKQMAVGPISLFLWENTEERANICSDEVELNARSVLWRIICFNSHPDYTFSLVESNLLLADKITSDIKSKVQTDFQNNLLVSDGNMGVYCFQRASW